MSSCIRFLFRCDISPEIGMGHLYRCLTLAKELKNNNGVIYFICRYTNLKLNHELKHVAEEIIDMDWSISPDLDVKETVTCCLEKKIDILIIDHYRADENYQNFLYKSGIKWLQFDGKANSFFWADWIINTNPSVNINSYKELQKNKNTSFLLGPKYALLRSEFLTWRPNSTFQPNVQKVLMTFGGGDDQGALLFTIDALKNLFQDIKYKIVLSSYNKSLNDIKNKIFNNNIEDKFQLCIDQPEIARIMADCDIAIVAGGTTSFEVISMGIPSLIIQIADNQEKNAIAWEEEEVVINLGTLSRLSKERFKSQFVALVKDATQRKRMSYKGKKIVDGYGTRRVAEALYQSTRD